jgi:hypothetical protein
MAPAFARAHQENRMSRVRQSNKELKKQPLLTAKEKKHAKQAKKHASDSQPLLSR